MRILAIDPGPHVGLSGWSDNVWDGEGEKTPADFYREIEALLATCDVVVIENFYIMGSRAKEANETIEMIGVVRYLCMKMGISLVLQSPADSKFASNEKLKRLGWYKPAKADHARSATRHLVTYLTRQRILTAADLLPSDAD